MHSVRRPLGRGSGKKIAWSRAPSHAIAVGNNKRKTIPSGTWWSYSIYVTLTIRSEGGSFQSQTGLCMRIRTMAQACKGIRMRGYWTRLDPGFLCQQYHTRQEFSKYPWKLAIDNWVSRIWGRCYITVSNSAYRFWYYVLIGGASCSCELCRTLPTPQPPPTCGEIL